LLLLVVVVVVVVHLLVRALVSIILRLSSLLLGIQH